MIAWFKRLVGDDQRLQRANQQLDEQYEELDEMSAELDRLCLKLDHVNVVAVEGEKAREEIRRTVSGSMRAVKLEGFDNEEAPTKPVLRKLPSGA